MNKELKAKWAAALRSGEYTQTQRVLRNPDTGGMCCLGVLCIVAGLEITDSGMDVRGHEAGGYDVIRGLLKTNPTDPVPSYVLQGKFVDANDIYGKNFNEIADMVDALPDD